MAWLRVPMCGVALMDLSRMQVWYIFLYILTTRILHHEVFSRLVGEHYRRLLCEGGGQAQRRV